MYILRRCFLDFIPQQLSAIFSTDWYFADYTLNIITSHNSNYTYDSHVSVVESDFTFLFHLFRSFRNTTGQAREANRRVLCSK